MRLPTFVIPAAIIGLIVAAWYGVWTWGSGRAAELIDRAIEQEAGRGRVIACASRIVGGFPFRMEKTCDKPTIEFREAGAVVRVARLERIYVVSQIWSPGHVIALATGPLTIETIGGAEALRVTWASARASAQLVIGGYEDARVVLDEPALMRGDAPLGRSNRAELFVTPNAEEKTSLDVAFRLAAARTEGMPAGSPAIDADLQLVARKILRRAGRPEPLPLSEWQAAGGALDLTRFRIAQGESVGIARGLVQLLPDGRPDGQIELRIIGLEQAAQRTGLAAVLGPLALGALTLASRQVEVEGRQGRLLMLRAADGALQFGPLRLPLPSIYQ